MPTSTIFFLKVKSRTNTQVWLLFRFMHLFLKYCLLNLINTLLWIHNEKFLVLGSSICIPIHKGLWLIISNYRLKESSYRLKIILKIISRKYYDFSFDLMSIFWFGLRVNWVVDSKRPLSHADTKSIYYGIIAKTMANHHCVVLILLLP